MDSRTKEHRVHKESTVHIVPPENFSAANNCSDFVSSEGESESTQVPKSTKSTGVQEKSKNREAVPVVDLKKRRQELEAAVLEVMGYTQRYQMGTVSPSWKLQFQKVLLMLEAQGSTPDDVYSFGEKFPQWVGIDLGNSTPVTPPRPGQILDFWDQVLSYDPAADKRRPEANSNKSVLDCVKERRAKRKGDDR